MKMVLIHNRWVLLGVACLINLCTGSIYAWSVFSGPKAVQLSEFTGTQITSSDLALVFSIASCTGLIPMIFGGSFSDKFGPKPFIVIGGLLIGSGLFFSGLADSVWQLIISYGIIFGLGLGFTYGATISNSIKWFPDHHGMAGGLNSASYGICSVLVPPLAFYLIQTKGISTAFMTIGILFGCIIVTCGLLTRKPPSGYEPEGWSPVKRAKAISFMDVSWSTMIRTPVFWCMFAFLLCGAISGMMIISQASWIAQKQVNLTAETATAAVSILALVNTAGRIIGGIVYDKTGALNTLTCALVICGLGVASLLFSTRDALILFYFGLCCIGLSFGTIMGVYPGFTADIFGRSHNSVNYGFMVSGFCLSGIIGPWLALTLQNPPGDYSLAYISALIAVAIGLIFSYAIRKQLKNATNR